MRCMQTPPNLQGGGPSMADHLFFKVLFVVNWLYLSVSLIWFVGEETAQTCPEQEYIM